MSTNTTLAITLAAGIAAGAGGSQLLSTATAVTPKYRAHAMDLRTIDLPDGGVLIMAEVWGKRVAPPTSDGGTKDLGHGFKCPAPSKVNEECRQRLIKDAASCLRDE